MCVPWVAFTFQLAFHLSSPTSLPAPALTHHISREHVQMPAHSHKCGVEQVSRHWKLPLHISVTCTHTILSGIVCCFFVFWFRFSPCVTISTLISTFPNTVEPVATATTTTGKQAAASKPKPAHSLPFHLWKWKLLVLFIKFFVLLLYVVLFPFFCCCFAFIW